MSPDVLRARVLLERQRRAAQEAIPAPAEVSAAATAVAIAATLVLRAWLYAKQAALFARDSARRKRATKKTRRAGATAGGVLELLARAIEQPDFRARYVTDTAKNARERAWENDSKSGFVDVLRRVGKKVKHPTLDAYEIGGVIVEVRDGDLALKFSNGSKIDLIGADSLSDHTDLRGLGKHVIWIDEAQDFPHLAEFYTAVVVGSLTDTRGECWLTGTPGKDLAGMFWEVTAEDESERLPSWDVHTIASTDNPFFGAVIQTDEAYWVQDNIGARTGPFETREEAERAATAIRFDNTAGLALRENNWKGDEPDYIREQLGRWVKGDANYVYPVHSLPAHVLAYAPLRLTTNPINAAHPPWYDHDAAERDLPAPPRWEQPYQWLYGIGADFGYWPDPFALVVLAFCYQLPDVYEMFSWKCTKVDTDEQGAYMRELWKIPRIVSFVGDAANKQSDFAVWQTRMNIPIDEANKKGKNDLEAFLAGDIRRTRVHFREKSPLVTEMQHLAYLPTKPGKPREVNKHRKVAGVIHGDHCADGARYLYADLRHYLAKPRDIGPEPGTAAWHNAQNEKERRAIEERQKRNRDAD